ncbi:MAG TPA: DEAD/DEAH box helicase [Streptosporangiaceae bacterium]|nr:DEAD/DEAH box helicase [Streptosporangiaceae bacterium]
MSSEKATSPRSARMLLGLLAKEGITAGTVTDIIRLLASAGRPSSLAAARALLAAAADVGALTVDDQTFQVLGGDGKPLSPSAVDPPDLTKHAKAAEDAQLGPDVHLRPLRIVALDIEAAVRARVDDGGTLRHAIWQLGAARFGPDQLWVDACPQFSRYVCMPEEFTIPAHRATLHAQQQVPFKQVMAEFAGYLANADMVVAYNGTRLDFPVLDGALSQAGQPPLPGARADGLYLAYCLWPGAGSHRLSDIVGHAGLAFAGTAHDAVDDAVNLAALMMAGAQALAKRDPAVLTVLTGLTPNAHSWRMLRSLAGMSGTVTARTPAQVAAMLWRALSPLPTRRGGPAAVLRVEREVRDTAGQVDPAMLARALHGAGTEPRPSQQQVTRILRTMADDAVPVLVEAPTGTGKSLSALAAALDWLGRDVRNIAIIATHTKALQSQLAREVEILSAAVPGLLESTDVVKGAGNRLSLRGLVYTLADASGAEVGTAGHLVRHTDAEGFRELLAFLLLRLVEPDTRAIYRWAAASVDVADLPAFFSEYCGKPVHAWTLACRRQRTVTTAAGQLRRSPPGPTRSARRLLPTG